VECHRDIQRLFSSLDLVKGLVVAIVCLALAMVSHVDDANALMFVFGVVVVVAPIGVGLGAIAGYVRTDRTLVLVASALGCIHVFQLLAGGVDGDLMWTYPWAIVGAIAIAMWTAPAPNVLPRARWLGPWMLRRPRWRRPSSVELAVALAIASSFVIALGVTPPPEMMEAGDGLWVHVHDHGIFDGREFPMLVAMLAAVAMPLGVLTGKFVEHAVFDRITWRLVSTLIVTAVCAGYGWMFVRVLGPFDLPAWSPVVIAIVAIALAVRPRHAGNGTSRDAGSTSSTP
jgi:hypothetical protein